MGSQEWKTPPELFAHWHAEYGFNVDAASTPENALVKLADCYCGPGEVCDLDGKVVGRYYTAETDGANPEHYGPGDRVFCNPPYSAAIVKRFVECAAVTSRERGAFWFLLLSATTTDTRWFHEFIWDRELNRPRDRVELRFLKGRIAFYGVQGTPIPSPRYSNMVAIFRPPIERDAP